MQRFPGFTFAVQRPICQRLQSCLPSTKISQSSGTVMPVPGLPFPFAVTLIASFALPTSEGGVKGL